MKNPMIAVMAIVMSTWIVGCSKNSGSTACGNAGYFSDQNDCQSSGGGSCVSVTTQSDGKNVVCWKVGTTTNNSTANATPTPGGNTGCNTGSPPPWSYSAWVPATCDGSAKKQVRTATCDYNCPCTTNKEALEQACEPNLVNKKHYSGECEDQGGEVVPIPGNTQGKLFCQFASNGCPSGWTTYSNGSTAYTITKAAFGYEDLSCSNNSTAEVMTGFHGALSATSIESRSYCRTKECRAFKGGGCRDSQTVYATVTHVACY